MRMTARISVIAVFISMVFCFGMAGAAAPTDGLVAAYFFDDGTALTDESGNNVQASVVGNVTFNADRSGSGLAPTFTNAGTYIQSNDAQLNGGWSGLTLSAWIKRNNLSTYGAVIDNGINFSWSNTTGYYGLRVGGYSTVFGDFYAAGGNVKSTFNLRNTTVGRWYMITGTYDGTTLRYYVDGELNKEVAYVGGDVGTETGVSTRIGNFISPWTDGYFPGQIDDVFIYSRGLSAEEVSSLYASSALASTDNCPSDPDKTEPGICGCGIPDTDTDNDLEADCVDAFPTDPNYSQDTDGDGLADEWENANFNNDLTVADAASDTDGDGISDLDEFNDGTDPNVDFRRSGLLAHYPFNEDASDISGNGNNGTVNGNSTDFGAGMDGRAIQFNNSTSSSGDYASLSSISLNTTDGMTISHWVKWDSTQHAIYGHHGASYSIGRSNATPMFSFSISRLGEAIIYFYSNPGVNALTDVLMADVSDKAWHLLTFTSNSTTASLYLDGALIGNTSLSSQVTFNNLSHYAGYSEWHNGWETRFNGAVDNLRIYGRPLSAAEVSSLHDNPDTAGLVLWNKLDSQAVVENSEAGLNGTFGGGSFVAGKFGNALSADHTQDLLTTFPEEVINADSGAIEFWGKLDGQPTGFSTGTRPYFILAADGFSSFGMGFNSNNGGSGGGLCGNVGRTYLTCTGGSGSWAYEQVLGAGAASDWHHYALVWNKNGIPGVDNGSRIVAVYLDGQLESGQYLNYNDSRGGADQLIPLSGGSLGLLSNDNSQGTVAIDNIKIWDFAKTDYSDRFTEGVTGGTNDDVDGDGYTSDVDCRDDDPLINPGAAEICDGQDNNCDGQTDEGALWSDLGAACSSGTGACEAQGTSICDLNDPAGPTVCNAIPGAPGTEVCDGVDNDCNGETDEVTGDVCVAGVGECERTGVMVCDIDPAQPMVCSVTAGTPVAEICDGLDNDCNGLADDGLTFDVDGDQYSTPGSCEGTKNDCNDGDKLINPGAAEIRFNGKDENCNGMEDDDPFGDLSSSIIPAQAITDGGQWSIDSGTTWHDSGASLIDIPTGAYTVTFKDITDWVSPGAQQVTITSATLLTITGTYTRPLPTASITDITPNPASPGELISMTGSAGPAGQTIRAYEWSIDRLTGGVPQGAPTVLGNDSSYLTNSLTEGDYRIYLRSQNSWDQWSQPDTMDISVIDQSMPDLALTQGDVTFLDQAGNPLADAQSGVPVNINVQVANIGDLDAGEVIVKAYDGVIDPEDLNLIGSSNLTSIIAGASGVVDIPWTPAADGCSIVSVIVEFTQPTPEKNGQNNIATAVLVIGDAASCNGGINVTAALYSSGLYPNSRVNIAGTAKYDWGIQTPVMGAAVTISVSGGSTYSTVTTSPGGRYSRNISMPSATGDYTATVTVFDGNRSGVITIPFTVVDPPELLSNLTPKDQRDDCIISFSGPGVYNDNYSVIGSGVTISANVRNAGPASTGDGYSVTFYDGPPSGTNEIETVIMPNLASGATATATSSGSWTPGLGTHNVFVQVDSLNGITETNELDNECGLAISIRDLTPDLYPSISFSGNPLTGETVTISADILNNGPADLPQIAFDVTYYDGYPGASNSIGTDRITGPLTQGGMLSSSFIWDTTGVPTGFHHIYVVVDNAGEIDEDNEANNILSRPLKILTQLPDLLPYIGFSGNPATGDDVTLIANIFNKGTTDLGAVSFDVNYYDGIPNGSNLIGSQRVSGPLAVNEHLTSSVVWNTTGAAPGFHTIYVKVDELNEVDEDSTFNNTNWSELDIYTAGPNLELQYMTFSNNYPSNLSDVTVRANLKNRGGQSTANETIEYYLGDPDSGGTLIGSVGSGFVLPGSTSASELVWTTPDIGGNVKVFVVLNGQKISKSLYIYKSSVPRPDLGLLSSDIIIDPVNPCIGDNVNIGAAITNTNAALTSPVTVNFYADGFDGNTKLGESIVISDLASGASTVVDATAGFISQESVYKIRVEILPGTQGDRDSSDNQATTSFADACGPPVANAGTDRAVASGSVVQLDGSASQFETGYNWTINSAPAGSAASISAPGIVNPTFTADLPGTYLVELVVTNNNGSTQDYVSITAVNPDMDGDGFNSYVFNGADCDDENQLIHPNAEEIPYNNIDENCSGMADNDDLDQDGYDFVNDCDDQNPNANPSKLEIPYNGIDEDCDGYEDDDDLDSDGYPLATDCDDDNPVMYPGNPEVCDGFDNNCDSQTDEGLTVDADGDGHSTPESCEGTKDDCNDNDPAIFTGTVEECGGVSAEMDQNWAMVATGKYYTVGLKTDGTLWSWGYNIQGQLGLGESGAGTDRIAPDQVGIDNDWVSVEAGGNSSFGLKSDGSLWAWGSNSSGVLGVGTWGSIDTPTQVLGDAKWVSVAAGGGHSIGLKSDGTLWAWGSNFYGAIGLGDADSGNDRNSPVQIGSDRSWVSVATGENHTIGLKSDGTIWAWGLNYWGQLGLGDGGDGTNRNAPTIIGTDNTWVAVVAGGNYSIGLKADGTLWAWGNILFADGTCCKRVPTQIGSESAWITISAGHGHAIVLKTDGTLWSWGQNNRGQLGDGSDINRLIPVQVGFDNDWVSIAGGYQHSFGLKSDGTLHAWGGNMHGELGDGTKDDKLTPTPVAETNTYITWTSSSAGEQHTTAIQSDGTLWSWGNNNYGQLGLGDSGTGTERLVPTQIGSDDTWILVSSAFTHTLGIKSDGTLWAWGSNSSGGLGDGTFIRKTIPTPIGSETSWVTVAAGRNYSLGLKSDGSLWSWGYNGEGQLGLGDAGTGTQRYSPTRVGDENEWIAIAAGDFHALGLKSNGTLWSWGYNAQGQLGLGDIGAATFRMLPTKIGSDSRWVFIDADARHNVALKSDGSIWSWGQNRQGQLGLGDSGDGTERTLPTRIGNDTWISIAAGLSHSIGLKSNGTLWSWGANSSGQLGDGSNNWTDAPMQVGSDNTWVTFSAGNSFSIAHKSDGSIWGWGYNDDGRIGDGTRVWKNYPVMLTPACAGKYTPDCIDPDEDGVLDPDDNCPDTANPGQEDFDGDGFGDACDNCVEVINPDQRDTNFDEDDNSFIEGMQHYGNMCDGDFDNNGIVEIRDFILWRPYAGQATDASNEDMDINGNGAIWTDDFILWRGMYGKVPGPGVTE